MEGVMTITGYMTRGFYEALEENPTLDELLEALGETADDEIDGDVFVTITVETS